MLNFQRTLFITRKSFVFSWAEKIIQYEKDQFEDVFQTWKATLTPHGYDADPDPYSEYGSEDSMNTDPIPIRHCSAVTILTFSSGHSHLAGGSAEDQQVCPPQPEAGGHQGWAQGSSLSISSHVLLSYRISLSNPIKCGFILVRGSGSNPEATFLNFTNYMCQPVLWIRIRIILKGRIRIRIKVISWIHNTSWHIRVRIKVKRIRNTGVKSTKKLQRSVSELFATLLMCPV